MKVSANTGDIIIIEQEIFGAIELPVDSLGNSKLYFGENLNNFIEWSADKDAFVFSNNINFGGNEVLNFRLENLVSAPQCNTDNSGRMYHNTTDKYSYICDDAIWKVLDNDDTSAQAVLPFLYNVSPNFLGFNVTADVKITGENLQNITHFELSNGVVLNSFEVLNSEEAVLHVTTGNADAMIDIIALNKGEQWSGNALKLKVASSLGLNDVLDNFDNNAEQMTEWIPELYPLTLDVGPTANYIYDGGGDNAYDKGNYLNTGGDGTGKKQIYYTDKIVVSDEQAFGVGGKYFTLMKHNIFILSATVGDGFSNFYTNGFLGADSNGMADVFVMSYNGYNAYIKRVYGAGSTPSINHIYLVDSSVDAEAIHEFSTNTNFDNHELKNLEKLATIDNNKFYYFAFALKNGEYISDDNVRNLTEFIVDKMLSSF
ncbi:TPA: hypothetical protein EYG96_02800 [Candidatus Gracilibacteria bacterium]|nr:hypothetical protein [Candidatus Peregrinibacteria bacterium]HIQ56943.1 hypothetical protein [Candidatus Gracilibacteria bacterium]HIQ57465.1 hypothetical protein [Candidatus Gracilibacteria bacterium]